MTYGRNVAGKTHAEHDQADADLAPSDSRRLPDKCEEISEDAYKQNYVYRAWVQASPKEDKAA